MKLSLRRKFKGSKYTIGDLSIDGTFFCNTIEDVIRELPDSCPNTSRWIPCKCKEKVYARTAIPAGTYKVTLEYSPKFKRKMPYLHSVTRCEFVNEVFDGYNGWEIQIDIKCRKLTQDLIYQLRNEDGTKSTQKTTDPKTGVKYERYGHLSDCLDYLLCYYLRDSWYKYKSGGDGNGYVVSTSVISEGFNY